MNNVVLMGRLVADPELKNTNTGKEVTNFRIAVERPYQKGEERQADFVDVVVWGKTAAFVCQYFHKGKPIAVSGRLQVRSYDASDGSKRKVVEVVANNVEFVTGDKSDVNTEKSTVPQTYVPAATAEPTVTNDDFPVDNDLPF